MKSDVDVPVVLHIIANGQELRSKRITDYDPLFQLREAIIIEAKIFRLEAPSGDIHVPISRIDYFWMRRAE